jgi:hypothetical protein
MALTLAQVRACPNQLLSKLSDDELGDLLPYLEMTEMHAREILYQRNHPVVYVYFPCTAGISELIYLSSGATVEVCTVGNEGFTNVELLIGLGDAIKTGLCQVAGHSLRMKARDFSCAVEDRSPLRRVAECYLQGHLAAISQSVACNRVHTMEARFARWLLLTHDRVRGDNINLTQDFLADMLGVQRPSISVIAGAFQKAGMIRYSRGNLTIVDRAALEATTCECYEVVREQFRRSMGVATG